MYEKLVEATRRSMALLDDVVYVLTSVLSGAAISRDTRFGTQHTVTAELTKRAKMNAVGLVLASTHARLAAYMCSRTYHILTRCPKIHINGIENSQKCETPGNFVDNDLFPFSGKLVDDRAQ